MSARWIAAMESRKNKTFINMEYSGRALANDEWVVKAHLVKKLREDAERAGHQYLVDRLDHRTKVVVSSRNKVWKQDGIQTILAARRGEKPAAKTKKASQQPQQQPRAKKDAQPTAAADLTELKQLVRQLLQQLEELD